MNHIRFIRFNFFPDGHLAQNTPPRAASRLSSPSASSAGSSGSASSPGRVRLGPKCREEINAEIDSLLYRLKTEPKLPRRQAVLKRIGDLAALLAQALAVIAVATMPAPDSAWPVLTWTWRDAGKEVLLPLAMTSPPSRIAFSFGAIHSEFRLAAHAQDHAFDDAYSITQENAALALDCDARVDPAKTGKDRDVAIASCVKNFRRATDENRWPQ